MTGFRRYKIPNGWGGIKEVDFWWDGQSGKDIENVQNRVRSMRFSDVENMLVDFIMLQLREKIIITGVE